MLRGEACKPRKEPACLTETTFWRVHFHYRSVRMSPVGPIIEAHLSVSGGAHEKSRTQRIGWFVLTI
jgi:hypothetical protein